MWAPSRLHVEEVGEGGSNLVLQSLLHLPIIPSKLTIPVRTTPQTLFLVPRCRELGGVLPLDFNSGLQPVLEKLSSHSNAKMS